MGYKAITQIIISIVALVIIFTYIKPALVSVGQKQDDLYQFAVASDKAIELNSKLSELSLKVLSFKSSDIKALDTYLPSNIDSMKIMADIVTMANSQGMNIQSLSSGSSLQPLSVAVLDGESVEMSDGTNSMNFELKVIGSYESFKLLLQVFEQNNYPLEIVSLSFVKSNEAENSLQGDEYNISLRTYAYKYVQN